MSTYAAVLLAASTALNAGATGLPKDAETEMEFRVGKWESIGFIDGVEQSKPGSEVTRWVPGKYCIQITGSFVEDGTEITASGLVGWDADKKQLVEHWYSSDGGYSSFRYFLGKRKDSWVGTFTWVYPDGRKLEGESVVQKKGKNKWDWKASYLEDGKKHTWRTINRRVK
jgi:hypothetical protein